jgi:hypothetical protein
MAFPMLLGLHLFLLQASVTGPINLVPWFGVSFVVALVVIIIAALLYMLAPVMNSSAMQDWSRFQIYEAILSIALILLFLAVVKLLFLNPQQGFGSVGLVPPGCSSSAVNTIYTLSTCDLAQFNSAGYSIAGYMWTFSIVKAILPASTLAIQPTPQEGDGLEITFSIPNVLDIWNDSLIRYMMGAILTFMLVSEVQLIVLSSSLLLMSFFFAIGLVSRVFGVSRSFGGAMIAFAIGIGIVYPMVTAISYGYIDVAAHTSCIAPIVGVVNSIGACQVGSFGTAFWNLFGAPFAQFFALGAPASGAAAAASIQAAPAALVTAFVTMFDAVGYVLAGLTLIPVINILIVDVFVIDFSRAVGEQMSFSMLFTQVI